MENKIWPLKFQRKSSPQSTECPGCKEESRGRFKSRGKVRMKLQRILHENNIRIDEITV
jgi:hypothetical protein